MPSPGWYADPQDPSGLRWFDGENWTQHQQPAAPAAADAWSQQTAAAVPQTPDYGAPTPSYQPAAAASGTQPTAFDYGQGYQSGGAGYPPAQPYSDSAQTTWFAPAATPPMTGPPVGSGHQARRRASQSSSRMILVVALVAVLVVGLLAGGWWLFLRSSSATFTLNGKTISHPAVALDEAESNLRAIVAHRHGVENSTTRCYYAQADTPASGAKKSDVDNALRCGPVLFVDGDASKPFLTFALNATPVGNGVTLSPSAAPQSNAPAGTPVGFALKRPDGKTPPSGTGGLSVPNPPAADPGVITAAVVTPASSTSPKTVVIGSLTGGITITDAGKVSRYGTGDDARSAPANQQLYAFKLSAAAGNDEQDNDLSTSTTLSVDGAAGLALPVPTAGQMVVAAVPSSAKTLDLVLSDSGITQTYSLLTRTPGANNIQVLARTHRDDAITKKVAVTFHYAPSVVFSDNTSGQSQAVTVSLSGVTLTYRDDVNSVTASAPDMAFLIPDIVFTGAHDGGPYGLNTSLLTFTPTGGTAIKARNISTDPNKIRNVFEVPAGVTTGTLTVSGSAVEQYAGGGGKYTVSVVTAASFALTFAAG